ncbi:MAG: M28 family peptidase [Bacteroidetes bacterium]|nr:M28 family peptidase [Bacteroidota bacterium]
MLPLSPWGKIATFVSTGLLGGLVVACSWSGPNASPTQEIASKVREAFSGDRAKETVAFLDQHVRWPGNEGFDASIGHVATELAKAGFVLEEEASETDRLTYRIESYPMSRPAWQPLDARLQIVGDSTALLEFASNRNMLATNSFSTKEGGVSGIVVDAGDGSDQAFEGLNVKGKIVLVEGQLSRAFQLAVVEKGALGILAYALPDYLKPDINQHSIQFRSIAADEKAASWGISLSKGALNRLREAMSKGEVRVEVETQVKWIPEAVELTVIADVKGSQVPDERFVFSAHVQEPGANDNASGVGAQLEMARVASALVLSGEIDPKRSISFIWGDEIRSTNRYVTQDSARAKGILWGMSLDMVGEDTEKTGGTFLIEKMPDPSAIWTRGEEKHTEWGGSPLTKDDMTPHYFNDLVLNRALEQAATNGWVVKTNPFEGGSDHVPFLRSNIPGLLLWHFTDQFYHTDRDRIEMVSANELKNVGVTALVTALGLTTADGEMAQSFIQEVGKAAEKRLRTEYELSVLAINSGGDPVVEEDILSTWNSWYEAALTSTTDIEVGGPKDETLAAIDAAKKSLNDVFLTLELSKN